MFQQGKQTLIGFPALVDRVTHCDLEVFDDQLTSKMKINEHLDPQ